MSHSTLYTMNKEFKIHREQNFSNSWWFTPNIWDVIENKYGKGITETEYGFKLTIINDMTDTVFRKLNQVMNKGEHETDQICWELAGQQVFFTKDKNIVADAIRTFVKENVLHSSFVEKERRFELEHIQKRFEDVAQSIDKIDEEKFPYFIFKNTSVDDSVERWFYNYNDEDEDYLNQSLAAVKEHVVDFVVIEDGKVKEFIMNTEYDYKKHLHEM